MPDDANRSLVIENERAFATDRATLFRTFAQPGLLEKWWGPHGFTNRIETFDFRNGGSWVVVMTSSSDADFENHWTFEEIVPDGKIVAFHHGPMHAFSLEVSYEDLPSGTLMTWRMSFEDTDDNRQIEKFLSAANEQNFDRLEALLADIQDNA